jgi:hypothetical protein
MKVEDIIDVGRPTLPARNDPCHVYLEALRNMTDKRYFNLVAVTDKLSVTGGDNHISSIGLMTALSRHYQQLVVWSHLYSVCRDVLSSDEFKDTTNNWLLNRLEWSHCQIYNGTRYSRFDVLDKSNKDSFPAMKDNELDGVTGYSFDDIKAPAFDKRRVQFTDKWQRKSVEKYWGRKRENQYYGNVIESIEGWTTALIMF